MTDPTESASADFEELLEYLRSTRGFEFRAYKRPGLERRIRRRMDALGISSYPEYQSYLDSEPDEHVQLFNTVLINVTTFFRDSIPWQYLADEVVPQVVARKRQLDPIRIWSAGCATGEEAYTLAMILAEALGVDGYRSRVKIYATDVDEDALAAARTGSFDPKDIESIPPALVDKYFERADGRYTFRTDLRDSVTFGRHDLLEDPPISHVDILVCRNTLMYFNGSAQSRVLSRLHFALNDGGFLFLGKAETLLAHGATFKPVEVTHRVFTKVSSPRVAPSIYLMPSSEAPVLFTEQKETVRAAPVRRSSRAQPIADPLNLDDALQQMKAELDNVYEQLESTKEQMETTNEELQSTVEELETTNETLQAANAELETMNRELQSANQEVQESVDVARAYTRELDSSDRVLEWIYRGFGHRVIVVDRSLHVLWWNDGAEELWGVSADEAINVSLPQLGIGFPVESLKRDIDSILAQGSTVIVRDVLAVDARGKKVGLRVTLASLMARDDESVGGIVFIIADGSPRE